MDENEKDGGGRGTTLQPPMGGTGSSEDQQGADDMRKTGRFELLAQTDKKSVFGGARAEQTHLAQELCSPTLHLFPLVRNKHSLCIVQ